MHHTHVVSIQVGSEKLRQRVSGLSLIENHLSRPLEDVLRNYKGTTFRDSGVDKEEFFKECLSLELSESSERLIAERCKLSFHKDMRSSIEYGLDLVFGWLSEDLVLEVLKQKGVAVELAGKDRHREFLFRDEIGTASDFCVNIKGILRPLEIVFSWNNYWKNTDTWDLRDSKFRHLIKVGEESLCLGVELPGLEGFLIDMKYFKASFIERANPAWGNKNSYRLTGMRTKLRKIDSVLDDLR